MLFKCLFGSNACDLGWVCLDQSGIRIVEMMQVSIHLRAILILQYLDSISAILLPRAEYREYILRIHLG